MLSFFRIIMIIYIVLMITIILASIFVLYYYSWITDFLAETIEFFVYIIVAITFRLRKENIYFYLTDEYVPPTPRASVRVKEMNEVPFSKTNASDLEGPNSIYNPPTNGQTPGETFTDIPLDLDTEAKTKTKLYGEL